MALAKVPLPLDVHVTLAWLVAFDPVVMLTAPVEAQVTIAVPATAVGAGVMVRVFVEVTLAQPLVAVKVKVTLPAALSAALGV